MKSNRSCAVGIAIVLMLVTPCLADIEATGDVSPADPATWDDTTFANIGSSTVGTLSVTNGSEIATYTAGIGNESTVLVDGFGSAWTNDDYLRIGGVDGTSALNGTSTLNITGGGQVTTSGFDTIIGWSSPGTVHVDGPGSILTSNTYLMVGEGSNGTLNITNGGVVSSSGAHINYGSPAGTGTVTVDGAGSLWTTGGTEFGIGCEGLGTLTITNGGAVVSNSMCYIGLAPTSQGYVVVDGDGSTWTTGHLHVGYMGASDLTISNGGKVFSSGADIGHLESWQHSIAVDGIGSMWMNRGGLSLGTYAQPGQKVTLSITDGGQVAVAGPFSVSSAGVDYQINMSTGGMLTLNGHADASLASFLALIEGPAPIRYWDNALMDWADITGATYGEDYTLTYLTEGDLAGYTVLTVPEPATMSLLALGGVAMLRKRR